MQFTFTNEYPDAKIDEIVAYLHGPRLWVPRCDYPDFDEWAGRAHTELRTGAKRALIALHSGDVVGALIYQKHKGEEHALELKNLTVRPDYQGRYIASFLVRNAEAEGYAEFGTKTVIGDTKVTNLALHVFLRKHGYVPRTTTDLYRYGAQKDILFTKKLTKKAMNDYQPCVM